MTAKSKVMLVRLITILILLYLILVVVYPLFKYTAKIQGTEIRG